MEIITEINTNDLLNIMKTAGKGTNIKTFSEDIKEDYYLFEKVIKFLNSIDYNITFLLESIYIKDIFIVNESELNEITFSHSFKLEKDLYLIVE